MSRSDPFPPSLVVREEPGGPLVGETPLGPEAAAPKTHPDGARPASSVWERILLPVMIWMLVGLTLTFLALTVIQLNGLQRRIEAAPVLDLTSVLSGLDTPATAEERIVFPQWKTLALLEQHALARRYHQANVLLMARTWTSYLGYLTGMMLAMVGAAFILGKLREEVSSLGLDGAGIKATLRTTSPGLALCFLGTVLILGTIVTHNQIQLQESGPLYLTTMIVGGESLDLSPLGLPSDSIDVFTELEARVLAPAGEPGSNAPPADP